MTPDQYLSALREIGWFEGLPSEAASDAEANVRRAVADGRDPEPWPEPAWFDCESIYEPGDYTALLDLFASASYGTFQPTNVREEWDDEAGETVVQFGFDLNGKRFERTLRGDDEWVSPDLFDLLAEAMDSQGHGLAFCDIETGDQTALFFLCNAKAFVRADDAGLIPKLETEEEEE